MTEPHVTVTAGTTAGLDERSAVAEELALLTMLSDRVAAEIARRKQRIADTWKGGDKATIELPNPDAPSRPIKVGTVRADGGQGVARIADRNAWVDWCQRHAAHNVVHQDAGWTSTPVAAIPDLEAALRRVVAASTGFAPDHAGTFLDALEDSGWIVTRREAVPERTVVMESWEKAVLEATQKAGKPTTPDGNLTPEGVEFVEGARLVKPVVTIGKDETMREQFVAAHRDRLPEITGRIIDPEEAGNGR